MLNQKTVLENVPIEQLQRGPYQVRHDFNPELLRELAESIRSQGLIQPIVVRPAAQDGVFEIIAGERRWRAAQYAALDTVPCLVRSFSNEQAAAAATIENVQRVDLNPIEDAQGYQRLIDEFDYGHEEIAAMVGVSRVKITHALGLLRLDERVQQLLVSGKLNAGHGKVLAGVASQDQMALALQCVQNGWSVRKIERVAKTLPSGAQPSIQTGQCPDQTRLERLVSDQFGAQVKLETDQNQSSGWLKIRYFSNDTLAGLLDKMGIHYEDA